MLVHQTSGEILPAEEYSIEENETGLDRLVFSLPRHGGAAASLLPGDRIRETESSEGWLLSSLDAGQTAVICYLRPDLSDWEQLCIPGYTASGTAADILRGVLPEGWTLSEDRADTLEAEITMYAPTPLDIALYCEDVFSCSLRFFPAKKTVRIAFPLEAEAEQEFLLLGANLRALPECKETAEDLITRLYPIGKDGITIATVNNGLAYIDDFSYTSEIRAGSWQDERFTIPKNLLAAARRKLPALSQPQREWEVNAADLSGSSTAHPGFSVGTALRLIDSTLGQNLLVRITSIRRYPLHPERDVLRLVPAAGTGKVSY